MRKDIKHHVIYFIIFLAVLFIFTFPLAFKMDRAVYGPLHGTDNRAAIWHFWWFNYSHQHNLGVDTNIMNNYPFGIKHMGPKIFPLCMIPAYLFSIFFNEIVAYNAMIIISFILSFLCMYALVFYLTKRHSAAFISGLIYSFSPYHINKSWEHFGLMFIEFIPLYILFLLKLREKPNIKHLILCSLSLALVVLSDLTYSFIIFVFSLFYVIFCFFYYVKNKSFRGFLKLFFNFLLVVLLSSIFILPLLWPSFVSMINPSLELIAIAERVAVRPFNYLFSQSASILAYLAPSKYHPLWGCLARSLEGSIFFGRGSIEQTLYLGWIGLFLAFIFLKKKRNLDQSKDLPEAQVKFTKSLFVFMFFLAVIFSMPPYWNLLVFKIYFPSFFIYKIFPVYRAYARFGVLAVLSVAVLAGYGFSFLKSKSKRKKMLTAIFSLLVLFDFANIPPLRVTDMDKCPPVYTWLARQKDSFAIAEYPVRLGDMAEGYVNLDYLLYQRFHQKAILEGAEPGTSAFEIKRKIARITDPETPKILGDIGFKYVILHLDEYRQANNIEAVDILGEVPDLSKSAGLKFINRFGDDEVYEVVAQ